MTDAFEEMDIWVGLIDPETNEPLSDRIRIRMEITRTDRDVMVGRNLAPLSFKGIKQKPFVVGFFWAEEDDEPFHTSDPSNDGSVKLHRIQ